MTGAVNAVGYDVNAACYGFVIAFHTAQAYIHSGICRTVLVIGAERMSRMVDWSDRGTCILFGDGAGAVVVKAEEKGIAIWQHILTGQRAKLLWEAQSRSLK